MNFKLSAPYYLENENYFVLPAHGEGSGNDILYVLSNDEDLTFAMYNGIAGAYTGEESFTATAMNAVADNALSSLNHKVKSPDLAVALFHVGGCLVALTGHSRILQIREGKVLYDSRSQVLDVYAAETKVMQLTDVQPGDVLVMEVGRDKFDVKAVTQATTELARPDGDFDNALRQSLGDSAQSMTFVVSQVNAAGEPLKVKDLSVKWWLLYAALIALLFGFVLLSLNGFGNIGNAIEHPITHADTTQVSTYQTTAPHEVQ